MKTANQDATAAAERMKAYIDANIKKPITAKTLADAAGYSQAHAARIFKLCTGRTPFEYIRERRLVSSALALRSGGARRIIDVAFDFVFDSHEGFTRAFTKAFGIAPKRFSSVPKPSDWLIPFQVSSLRKFDQEAQKMDTAIIFTQIVERPARKLMLWRSKTADNYFDYVAEVGCGESDNSAPWDVVSAIKEAMYEPVGLWLPGNMRPDGTGIYAHGVELPAGYSGAAPDGFDTIDLPPCKMLVFQGEPYDDEQYQQAIGALWERIAKFNPEVYGYEYADELAPRMQLAPMGWRGYIEMRPIREIAR
ncbi:MAG: AraC family transcriptional regulator [Oscillospiraceae bacterium]|nr:AraC family transcriptional regulator [Oscillospiraceae bacterium]